MIESRGIDSNRMIIVPVVTVQEFRQQAIKIIDKYLAQKEEERKPLMFCLDSLGMLSTSKEVDDTEQGKDTRDMTRAQVVKSIFRVLTLKLGKANVPMLVTNHTYDVVGSYIPMKEMGGGSGLKYAASTIIYLSKSKEKDGKEVIDIIKCELRSLVSQRRMLKLKRLFMMNVDWTSIGYWNWVRNMESSRGSGLVIALVNLMFLLSLSLPI